MQSIVSTSALVTPVQPPSDAGLGVRAGYGPAPLRADRAERLLRAGRTVWIGSVCTDGRPHLVPTWFTWAAGAVWVATKPEAMKVRNLRLRPTAALAVGDALADFDVQLVEASAEILDRPMPDAVRRAHERRYGRALRRAGVEWDDYWTTYTCTLRLVPLRFSGWHGRGSAWGPTYASCSFLAVVKLSFVRRYFRMLERFSGST